MSSPDISQLQFIHKVCQYLKFVFSCFIQSCRRKPVLRWIFAQLPMGLKRMVMHVIQFLHCPISAHYFDSQRVSLPENVVPSSMTEALSNSRVFKKSPPNQEGLLPTLNYIKALKKIFLVFELFLRSVRMLRLLNLRANHFCQRAKVGWQVPDRNKPVIRKNK